MAHLMGATSMQLSLVENHIERLADVRETLEEQQRENIRLEIRRGYEDRAGLVELRRL
jgi:hypothetical protein